MRKIMITTVSIVLLGSVGIGFAIQTNADKTYEAELQHSTISREEVRDGETEEQETYEEYAVVNDVIHIDDFNADVVEDNKRKRIIVFNDDHNRPQYKTVYIKKKNRLKVIDFKGGLLFNDVITNMEETEQEGTYTTTDLSIFKETTILEEYVDVANYHVEVTTDNPHKRVIILYDDNHRLQVKSIYVKEKNYLKVIDLNDDLLYDGTI